MNPSDFLALLASTATVILVATVLYWAVGAAMTRAVRKWGKETER